MRLFWIVIFLFSGLMGCAHQEVEQRAVKMESAFLSKGFSKLDVETRNFTLRAWKSSTKQSNMMHVYIEGDGFAWVTRHQPSRNPTPIDSMVPSLAMLDTSVNTVYLARPCQYVSLTIRPCDEAYWTKSRFSSEVVDSMSEAITQLKKLEKIERIVLIGYSGGGAIAALIAAKRTDVSKIITVAGNLDHRAWTNLHRLSDLNGSLNPPDYWKSLLNVSQTHFVGERDTIVPSSVYQSYRKAFPQHANINMEILAGFDHKCCWVDAWQELLQRAQ